jgi:hypothetical protein
MLIDAESTILYSKRIEEHEMGLCVFMREDDGFCVRLEKSGREFFKEIPLLSPNDNYHEGEYKAIENIKLEVEKAIKDFTGIIYDVPNLESTLLFQLLHMLKFKSYTNEKHKL